MIILLKVAKLKDPKDIVGKTDYELFSQYLEDEDIEKLIDGRSICYYE